jgi:hypothetical protein
MNAAAGVGTSARLKTAIMTPINVTGAIEVRCVPMRRRFSIAITLCPPVTPRWNVKQGMSEGNMRWPVGV